MRRLIDQFTYRVTHRVTLRSMRQFMHKAHPFIASGLGAFCAALSMAADPVPSAQQVLSAADHVRNPGKPFRLRNKLTEYVNGAARSTMGLVVYSKEDPSNGQFRNLIRYVEPAREAGKAVLLNSTKMWFYDPSSKASVRISPQQRLIGQAAEGDVVTVNFSRDYAAKILGTEKIQDADHEMRNCWHLNLTPSKEDAIYGRIEYWVEQGSSRPIKGKFYSDSGRLLKIAYYHHYQQLLGNTRPAQTTIIDAVNPREVTTMQFSDYAFVDIPDAWFQREYLPHLKAE